jgi:hypothetical protein
MVAGVESLSKVAKNGNCIDGQGTLLDNEMYKSTKLFHFFAQNCVCWSARVNSFNLEKTTLTFGVLNHNKRDKKITLLFLLL